MSEPFDYDVFLSHSAKDRAVVRSQHFIRKVRLLLDFAHTLGSSIGATFNANRLLAMVQQAVVLTQPERAS